MNNSSKLIINKREINWLLNVIIDHEWLKGRSVSRITEAVISGGATVLQYRNKVSGSNIFFTEACEFVQIAKAHSVPCIINDRIDIALAVNADGVHLGQSDLPVPAAKKLLKSHQILGYSVSNPEEMNNLDLVDYLGVGALFKTSTKQDAEQSGLEIVETIRNKTRLPLIGIGGIRKENAGRVLQSGCNGVAVISEILSHSDVRKATQAIRHILDSQ